ncbi:MULTISPECIES: ABC transporter ATP-binding protein [Thermoactinomyces]|jgi:oligopeptide transport system ATP-binding protein|uniref:Dipeptide ABC transporter ATP-binding protein n=1 Tax=Thermoactinomyces daqus TaxID=1329516 RepID=A0A7W1X8U8_9BACL|nr:MULTISPECIES: dipeptide ABC transporter ATP-binding protein [Thermoactinomyces]MBA4542134.1 dipeptide ABC transporter ATP-binding protein [Thermoactinomyces daqus]MBH8598977.1 dipeptide ABC transporter ATP-binding protein [Thermoactinomyces sp. CICC 10523]MBH8604963.1 dipeptide ABC transporter ATP-binding protein [Thermoactinomyces sp. CICC 10522]MBH8608403.1 dipeptide ABC transporter ATP-binding protein [Thermoactinomyces sp. CICC 10521]
MALMSVRNLKKTFPIRGGIFGKKIGEIKAVDDVSFTVEKGETLGLVGESGCGKSTTGRTILRLYEPTAGEVEFEGKSILQYSPEEMRKARREMQMVFQDPFASLNPRQRIGKILEEPLIVHGLGGAKERKEQVEELLKVVGLDKFHMNRYPHQFSGGQRQRIGIARALSTKPKLIVADEPVSALDVSIQSQVLNLMMDLQEQFELTYIFIAHDLSVVKHISTRVGVMYLGRMVELAGRDELYRNPLHPYTQALMSAVPIPDPDAGKERIILSGDVPSPANPPLGCAFHPRCPYAMDVCKEVRPEMKDAGGGHQVACHLLDQ